MHLRPRALLLCSALLVVGAVGAQDNAALDEARGAGKYMADCYGAGDDAACNGMLSAYQRAMTHPQADDGLRHAVLVHLLHTASVYGERLRDAGRLPESANILSAGYQTMLQHLDGGKHFHTLIDNQRLQLQAALTMDAMGRTADRDGIIARARGAVESLYGARAQAAGRDHAIKLLHDGLGEGEVFEMELARHYAAKARDASDDAARDASLALSLEAYARADTWVRRQAETGAGEDWAASQAQISYERGMALWNADREEEASRSFAQSVASSCTIDDPKDRERLAKELANRLPGRGFKLMCQRSADVWQLTNGDFSKALDEALVPIYDQMLKELEEPMPPSLPTFP